MNVAYRSARSLELASAFVPPASRRSTLGALVELARRDATVAPAGPA
jgi:hypothetical protein